MGDRVGLTVVYKQVRGLFLIPTESHYEEAVTSESFVAHALMIDGNCCPYEYRGITLRQRGQSSTPGLGFEDLNLICIFSAVLQDAPQCHLEPTNFPNSSEHLVFVGTVCESGNAGYSGDFSSIFMCYNSNSMDSRQLHHLYWHALDCRDTSHASS